MEGKGWRGFAGEPGPGPRRYLALRGQMRIGVEVRDSARGPVQAEDRDCRDPAIGGSRKEAETPAANGDRVTATSSQKEEEPWP
jgi:hypothetical protein